MSILLFNDVTMSSTIYSVHVIEMSKTWRAPAPLLNIVCRCCSSFDELTFDVPKLGMNLAEQSPAAILDIFIGLGGDHDQAITECKVAGDSFLIQVWNQFFRQIQYDLKDTQSYHF